MVKPRTKAMCILCKGSRLLCAQEYCPLLKRAEIVNTYRKKKLPKEIYGKSQTIFVGHRGYPFVFVGPMTPIQGEDEAAITAIKDLKAMYGLSLNQIIEIVSLVVRGKRSVNVKDINSKLVERFQEIAMSIKPIYVENVFLKEPKFGLKFSAITQPLGPSGILKKVEIAENPKIPQRVEKIVEDDIAASEAIAALYTSGFDVYYLSNLLASGALGSNKLRKLVPTRWSITAVDDILGKFLLKQIREFQPIDEFLVYENTYLDNHFEILLMPGKWEFEQFEAWAPKTFWTPHEEDFIILQEYEGFRGKKGYAEKEAGGYYASRLAVLEFLYKIRKQAKAIVFREVYEGYVIPVGVWEVRENVRNAFRKKPRIFSSLKEALADIASRLRISIDKYLRKSEILCQPRLYEFS